MPIIVKYIIILEICSVSIEIKEIQLSILVADKIVTYRRIYGLTGFNKSSARLLNARPICKIQILQFIN